MKRSKRALALFVSSSLVLAAVQAGCATEALQAETQSSVEAARQASEESIQVGAQQSPEDLDRLVAPIALDPGALGAQVLAAGSYPTEVVEAERWMGQNPRLERGGLRQAVG